MKLRIAMLSIATILTGVTLSACFSSQAEKPQMQTTAFSANRENIPIFRIKNRNDAKEVITLARSLSSAGRYKESASIYLDAAKRFKSSTGNFSIDCKMAAVREYWLAGNLVKAGALLDQLEKEQDIYNRASETEDIRRLRTMLRDSANLKTASR